MTSSQARRMAQAIAARWARLGRPAGTVFVVVTGIQPQSGDIEKDVTAPGIDGDPAAFATGGILFEVGGCHIFIQHTRSTQHVAGGSGTIVTAVESAQKPMSATDLIGLPDNLIACGDRTHDLFRQAGGWNGLAIDDDRCLLDLVLVSPFLLAGTE